MDLMDARAGKQHWRRPLWPVCWPSMAWLVDHPVTQEGGLHRSRRALLMFSLSGYHLGPMSVGKQVIRSLI